VNVTTKLMRFSILLAALSLFFGCAATDKQLSRADLVPITTMTVAQVKSPPLLMETTGSKIAGVTGMMFGAIGGGIGGGIQASMMESNGRELQEKCNLPNYGDRVFKQFVDRIPKEVTGWPQIAIKDTPLSEDAAVSKEYALIVKLNQLKVSDGSGLSAWTTAKLRSPKGAVLWEKTIKYESKKSNRQCDIEILKADHGKLLREEYEFAILSTVSLLIDDLNGNPTKPMVNEKGL